MAELAGARSSWPVRANGLLLVLQAAGLGGIGAYEVYRVDWQQVEADLSLFPETLDLPETVVLPETVEGPSTRSSRCSSLRRPRCWRS